jgi:uracil-DNA glycosylase
MQTAEQQAILQEMGIDVWQLREDTRTPPGMDTLRQKVANCTACTLHCDRTQTVFGLGNEKADLMMIGEAPGALEDQQGEPFVGPAGQLLNAMLQSIGLTRDAVYVTNILKCRPPNNRDPEPTEIARCTPFLQQQINHIQPKIICAVGRIAAHSLLGTEQPIEKLRGQLHPFGENKIPLLVTYHPAYLLRRPAMKNKAYADFIRLKEVISL